MMDSPLQAVTNRFPQAGGNRVTEAPKVVCDLTQGDEGVETYPPKDSLKVSLIPPVRGCLRSFKRDWQTEKCSNNVLNIITNGYVLPFITKPKLATVCLIHPGYNAYQNDQALASCI